MTDVPRCPLASGPEPDDFGANGFAKDDFGEDGPVEENSDGRD